jgi:hypothetical protein
MRRVCKIKIAVAGTVRALATGEGQVQRSGLSEWRMVRMTPGPRALAASDPILPFAVQTSGLVDCCLILDPSH